MVAVHHLLHGDAFLLGADGYGHTVFVRATDEQHFLTLQAKIAHVDVGRHINARKVANMDTPVGVRQGGGNECSFKFFHVVMFLRIYISLQSYIFRANQRLVVGNFFTQFAVLAEKWGRRVVRSGMRGA